MIISEAQLEKHKNATGMVPLKFNGRYQNVNAGEIAGFDPRTAASLCSHEISDKDGKHYPLAELVIVEKK